MAVVPTGKHAPLADWPVVWFTIGTPQLSVAMGVCQVAMAPHALFWVILILVGQVVNVGAVWSTLQGFAATITLNAQDAVKLLPSLAV
jgi:hypothetical protein